MRIVWIGVVMAASLVPAAAGAQQAEPAESAPAPRGAATPYAPGIQPEEQRGAGAAGRLQVAPLNRVDANSPQQAGRQAVYKYLDDIAAKDEAARREAIAKITTRGEAEARQKAVRAKILSLLGGPLPERTPLNAKGMGESHIAGVKGGPGFRIVKVVYDSQPNFPVTALLYVPDAVTNAKMPAIVMAPGHSASGKAGDYATAAVFARNGFVVLSYDPIGQGERLQYPDPQKATAMQQGDPYPGLSLATRPTGEHGEAGLQPTLIGDAVARYFLWDGMRAVDYLESRPEVDAGRIGAFGCSGGGAMTALLGAMDARVKATATACYLATMDTLLPSIGAQDAEQSIPGFIASGFDFADWVELAAPRPYAMVGTVSDMFPWAGFLKTAQEARRFYGLFDASAEGTSTGGPMPPTPTGPTLNPDTGNAIAPTSPFQVIAGIGGHGNLRPLQSQIVEFFLAHLAHSDAKPVVPPPPAPGTSPAAATAEAMKEVPPGALQVTPTGQVATSYPGCETVYSLNLKRAEKKLGKGPKRLSNAKLEAALREVTKAEARPGPKEGTVMFAPGAGESEGGFNALGLSIPTDDGVKLDATVAVHTQEGRRHAVLLLTSEPLTANSPERAEFDRLAAQGYTVLAVTPRPSPPGGEDRST